MITYPTAPAPPGGWPVVSWAHGTTGLASPCAPSRSGNDAPSFGVRGVAVATDYIGLGPLGELHPYLSGISEADSVIDAVRAARDLPPAHAGRRWVAIGHSQGGHSALFTNQLAASYAPELRLVGTVSAAPAAELTRTFGPDDQLVPRMVGIMALYGLAQDYPQVRPADYVGPPVAAAAPVIRTGCVDQIVAAMVLVPPAAFYAHDPLTTPPAEEVVERNDPGHVRSRSPLLLVYGTADTTVVPASARALWNPVPRAPGDPAPRARRREPRDRAEPGRRADHGVARPAPRRRTAHGLLCGAGARPLVERVAVSGRAVAPGVG